MLLCFVDESGNDQVLNRPDAPPVLVIAGLVIAEAAAKDLLWGFLRLKKEFNPQAGAGELSELIRTEVKGADIRADIRSGSRRRRRSAIGFLDATLDLIEEANATIVGNVWVKADGGALWKHHYESGVWSIARDFNAQLAAAQTKGVMILDARTKVKNTPSVHTITTQRFKSGGDPLPYLAESPVFGHSDSHVGLQLADLVASAMLFPMACWAYCPDLKTNVHAHPQYEGVQTRWGSRLKALEQRYNDASGAKRGGLVVRDFRNNMPSVALFGTAASSAPWCDEPAEEPTPKPDKKKKQRRRTRRGEPVERPATDAAD